MDAFDCILDRFEGYLKAEGFGLFAVVSSILLVVIVLQMFACVCSCLCLQLRHVLFSSSCWFNSVYLSAFVFTSSFHFSPLVAKCTF